VALSTPGIGLAALPAVGEELSVDYRFRFGGFGPDVGHLTLWDGAGELRGWVGQAGDVGGLTTPTGLTVSRGGEVCAESDTCGAWSRYRLSVSVGGGGAVALDYGAEAESGGFQLVHGGYEASTSTSSTCADWYVGDVRVAAVRR
jgi:hypothetical protein